MTSRYTLPNGLTVVVHPQRTAPVVAFQVWVKVGSADETPDEIGLAHLHEHMLFKGTAKRGLGEIARSIEAHGGEINAWTSFDQTVYHVVMASRHAREGLDVLADAVRNSAFDEGELSREIEVVCEEIKRSLDMPSRRASKALFAESFVKHPYGRPVIGFEANVRAHTRARVLEFYRRHYRPSNMVLSAVGDLDEAQLRSWVDELFGGDWGTGPAPLVARPKEPTLETTRIALAVDGVKEAHVHLAFPIEGVDHPDTAALDVLAMLLGQGDSSRLSVEVKRQRSLVKDINAWAWTPKEPGLFGVSIVASNESLQAAFDEMLRVLATVTSLEVDEAELATVKALIEAEAVYQRETVQGLARKLGYYEAVVGGLEREARYYEAVARVSVAELREVARRTFTFERAIVSGLLPQHATVTEASLRASLDRVAGQRPTSTPARKGPSVVTPLKLSGAEAKARAGTTVVKLDSGATVIVREERSVPLFAVRATWAGGLRYETTTTNGVTALLSRTLTRGTATLDAEEVSHLIDSLAGSLGAIAGRSSMSLRGEFLSKHFARGFELFADVATAPAFPEREVARERTLLLQDIASRDDRPSSVAFELFAKTLFLEHPYRLSTLGERASVETMGRAEISEYHRTFMRADQLFLVVVGDVDTDEVIARAKERFGTRPPTASVTPAIAREQHSTRREARTVLQKAQTHLVLGFQGARVNDEWRRSLEVLQTILSGQSGRLFLELRDKRSMAYSVSAVMFEGVDPGYFGVYMGTSPEKVSDAIAGVRAELQKVCDDLVSERELERAREHLIGTHDIGLQRNGARAGVMALDACYGQGPEAYLEYTKAIAGVTREDVRNVARRVIDFERSALAVVGPEVAG